MGLQHHTAYASPILHVSIRCIYVSMFVVTIFSVLAAVAEYNLLLLFPITSFGWYLLYAF
jgi:hypothetical protein